MTITLELPMPVNLANARMHWRVKNRERKAYRETLDLLLAAKRLPSPPAAPLTPIVIRPALYVWSQMDDDNALARVKWAADWLKTRGFIVDDKRPHCRFEIPEQYIDRRNQRLVLTIAPASLTPAA